MADRDSNDSDRAAADDRNSSSAGSGEYDGPPKSSRFLPGQSGNPRGRPIGSKNRKTILEGVAFEMHTAVENGKRVRRPAIEFVLWVILKKALAGDKRANRAYHDLLAKFAPEATKEAGGLLVVSAEMTPKEWIAEQMELNKTRRPPPGVDDE